jgi:hypothetical protein
MVEMTICYPQALVTNANMIIASASGSLGDQISQAYQIRSDQKIIAYGVPQTFFLC